jgi:hypothetical protein
LLTSLLPHSSADEERMNSKLEAVVVILTAVSVIIIVFDIIFDPTGAVLTFIYAFDLGVVVILAIDLGKRFAKQTQIHSHSLL